jgi:uncharacterized membrane protein YqjE
MADAHHADHSNVEGGKHSFSSSVTELKNELLEFVRTRLRLFISELRQKLGDSKKGVIFIATALIFGGIGFLLLTLAAVGLVAVAFWGSPFAFFWGFLIIGVCYILLAAIAAIAGYYMFRGLLPNKTIKVLHDDKAWLQSTLSKS